MDTIPDGKLRNLSYNDVCGVMAWHPGEAFPVQYKDDRFHLVAIRRARDNSVIITHYRKDMTMTEIQQRIRKRIVQHLVVPEEKLLPDTRFDQELGADSLDIIELVIGIEEEFGITVPDEASEKMRTVGDLFTYVERALQAKAA